MNERFICFVQHFISVIESYNQSKKTIHQKSLNTWIWCMNFDQSWICFLNLQKRIFKGFHLEKWLIGKEFEMNLTLFSNVEGLKLLFKPILKWNCVIFGFKAHIVVRLSISCLYRFFTGRKQTTCLQISRPWIIYMVDNGIRKLKIIKQTSSNDVLFAIKEHKSCKC